MLKQLLANNFTDFIKDPQILISISDSMNLKNIQHHKQWTLMQWQTYAVPTNFQTNMFTYY